MCLNKIFIIDCIKLISILINNMIQIYIRKVEKQ